MLSRAKSRESGEFIDYLKQRTAPSTAARYYREIERFFSSVENPNTATYSDIMTYIGTLRKQYKNGSTINCSLAAIKKYYSYLNHQNIRNDNPIKSIRLRDKQNRDVQLQDLFTSEELEKLLHKKERYQILKNRNQVIISLLIYQGLTNGDIVNLELQNINLELGTIYIVSERKLDFGQHFIINII